MQKTSLFSLIREEVLRALVFGVSFFIILTIGLVGVANAANGGIFGDVLNKILATSNWENPSDGSVKNSQNLGGLDSSTYLHLVGNRMCAVGKCVRGFDAQSNAIICN